MSNILNKSNHPVEVKRISVKVWRLRDEIEAGIAKRIADEGHSDDKPAFIDDIKDYYVRILNGDVATGQDGPDQVDLNMDSSGNPMDDDAMAMMAALGAAPDESDDSEGDEKKEDSEGEDSEAKDDEEKSEDKEEADEESADEETDDEAAALAAQMLADQGMAPEKAEEGADDDAADLAAQMLADQGMGPEAEGGGDDAADLAAQMLADQGLAPSKDTTKENEKKPRAPFERVRPHGDKVIDGYVILSDVQMDFAMIFAQAGYIHGQNIIVSFEVPNSFTQMIEVQSSLNTGRNSKIISNDKSHFRLHCKFLFKFPGERANLRNFLQSIEPEIPAPPKKLKKPDMDEDDDDFDDLGF